MIRLCPETAGSLYERRTSTEVGFVRGARPKLERCLATARRFTGVAISSYYIAEWRSFDYALSSVNECYRGTLELADMGWPGGLRRLHGEDGTQKEVNVGQEED